MKKTLIALAALGVVGAASAQVSISGSIAVGIQNTMSDSAAKAHLTDADINFSGSEDLGGGLSISAATSISMENLRGSTDKGVDGSATSADGVTANNTTLTLAGGFGTVYYKNALSGVVKMGDISAEDDMSDKTGGYSVVNVVGYTTPALMEGLNFGIEYAGADHDATAKTRTDLAITGTPTWIVTYKSGPVDVYLDQDPNAAKGWDLRVKYDAGVAKIVARTSKDKQNEIGADMPLGAMTLGVRSVNLNGSKAQGVSLSYAMSKQTSLGFGYVSQQGSGTNYRLNLVKAF
jgi:hypothetical protein